LHGLGSRGQERRARERGSDNLAIGDHVNVTVLDGDALDAEDGERAGEVAEQRVRKACSGAHARRILGLGGKPQLVVHSEAGVHRGNAGAGTASRAAALTRARTLDDDLERGSSELRHLGLDLLNGLSGELDGVSVGGEDVVALRRGVDPHTETVLSAAAEAVFGDRGLELGETNTHFEMIGLGKGRAKSWTGS